jgi:hypothetical protein
MRGTMTRPSLLPDRDLTPDERAAHDEEPRPGTWFGDPGADGRGLTQDETDLLVRRELARMTQDLAEHEQILQAIGGRASPVLLDSAGLVASAQRGGIDSDPLVRLLAFRAWGDRDTRWFEQRGVRKGERITGGPLTPVALASRGDRTLWDGTAMHAALPGQPVLVDYGSMGIATCTAGDPLRADPSQQYPAKTSFEDWTEEALSWR